MEPPHAATAVGVLEQLAEQVRVVAEHEAAAFVERAQQLATEHAVDLERARSRQRDRQRREAIVLLSETRRKLYGLLADEDRA